MRTTLLKGLAGLLLALGCTGMAMAQIRVGSVADARGGGGWTLDGTEQTQARLKLLSAANFGAGGVVGTPVQITDTSTTITAGLLANFDVFYVGYFPTGTFSGAELAALIAWVNGGGTLVATCDDAAHGEVCTAFGHTPSNSAVSPVVPTVAGVAHPLFSSPFGVVSAVNMGQTQGYFPTANGATVLGVESSGSAFPVILFQALGAGRAIFIADVNIIANADVNTLTAGPGITSANDRFLANLFAFAGNAAAPPAPPVSNLPIPTLGEYGMLALVLLLAVGGMRRLRRNS